MVVVQVGFDPPPPPSRMILLVSRPILHFGHGSYHSGTNWVIPGCAEVDRFQSSVTRDDQRHGCNRFPVLIRGGRARQAVSPQQIPVAAFDTPSSPHYPVPVSAAESSTPSSKPQAFPAQQQCRTCSLPIPTLTSNGRA